MNPTAPRVFISYRRDDASGHAGRLYDAVAGRLGDANVFMDVEMKPGIDFVERITQVVGACRVLLVVIGPEWARPASGETESRLADPNDVVRLEVAAGLRRSDVSVIPLLVAGARMPDPDGLPEDLRALARVNALELSDLRWRYDVGRLMSALDEAMLGPGATTAPGARAAAPRVSSPARRRAAIAAGVALAVAGGVAALLLSSGDPHEPSAPSTATGDSVPLSVAKPGATPQVVHVDIRNSAGEQPTLTFHGTAGERIAPDLRHVTAPGSIRIDDPADETILPAREFDQRDQLLMDTCETNADCLPVKLKRTGTHELVIRGNGHGTGSLDLRLYQIARDIRKKISPTRQVRVELGVGQGAKVTFKSPGRQEQMLLRLRDIGFTGYVNVRDPADGLALEDKGFYASDRERKFPVNVPRAGKYTIYIRGNLATPYSGAVKVELVPPQGT